MNFVLKEFKQLSTIELFQIYQLRNEVFIVEQNCAYQDIDDKDIKSFHLLCYTNENLCAYCRILPPGVSYRTVAIGRVVVNSTFRNKGYGKLIMKKAIKKSLQLFSSEIITLSAQLYLKKFYEELGFSAIGNDYLEDDIPHIRMEYKLLKSN